MGWIYKGRFVSAHDEGNERRPTSIHDDPNFYPIFGEPKKKNPLFYSRPKWNKAEEKETDREMKAL